MKYSPEQLEKIEQFAQLYTKPSEIAIYLDIPEEEFKADINSEGHPARKAYIKGQTLAETRDPQADGHPRPRRLSGSYRNV